MGSKMLLFGFVALFAACANVVVASEKLVICYLSTWAIYRSGDGNFTVDDIQVDMCTHIVYTFAGIVENGTAYPLDPYLDLPSGLDYYNKFNALKEKNSNLKTILAVGGWNQGSANYSTMVANSTLRQNFISSIIEIMVQYGFDGCDMDWEYPNRRDSTNGEADIDNFSTLLKEMRTEFDKHGFLISAAVAAIGEYAKLSYDVPTISKYLDWVGLMSYDLYGSYNTTGYNAALNTSAAYENVDPESVYTVENAVDYWLGAGCPPEKLVIGLPFYGRTFTLTDANQTSVGSPSTGAGIAGPYTQEAGSIGYNELCVIVKNETWTVEYDDLAEVPYTYKDNNWVSFDNAKSLTEKVKYALDKNVTGVMIWSIDTDDFLGNCGEAYILLKTVNRAIGKIDEA